MYRGEVEETEDDRIFLWLAWAVLVISTVEISIVLICCAVDWLLTLAF